jgi:predicted branched-subunit amino acid permease
VAVIILTTLIINLRFMMYSASLRQHFATAPLRWRLAIGYLTADNVYGLALGHFDQHPENKLQYFLGAGLVVWAVWQLAVLGGVLIGAGVPASWRLEFAAPLAFIALTIPFLRERAMIVAALASGVAVIAAQGLPMRLNIVAAAAVGITAGLLFEKRKR